MTLDRLAEAKEVAKHSDVVILCLGLDETLEGEEGDTGNSYASGDKETLQLPEVQRDLMKAVAECGKPVILCLMAGSDIDLSFAREHFDAILDLWYPGSQGGAAAARVLFGDVSPSGKLPVTFYETLEELPEFTDYHMEGRTYRYMKEKAQYPFGFGLTYGDVRVADAQIQQEEDAADDTELTVRVVLENRGKMATDEVLQIYAQYLESENTIPHPQLCGFVRVHLDGGEKKEVTVPVKKRAFTIVTESGERKAAKGRFALYAGCSQPDEKSVELTGKRPVRMEYMR